MLVPSNMRSIIFFAILSTFLICCDGISSILKSKIDFLCGYDYLTCSCGKSREEFKIAVKLCQVHKWKPLCGPCNNKLQYHTTCQRFTNCESCDLNTLTCSSCPYNKYGSLCTQDCQCQNAIGCDQETGKCFCKKGFKGDYCNTKTDCAIPSSQPPLISAFYPPNAPIYINYTCEYGYHLLGNSHNICKNGKWHNIPPKCVKFCTSPTVPEYGEIEIKKESTNIYAAGEIITYRCKNQYFLIGDKINECNIDGKWRNVPPKCVKLKFCSDPGIPKQAERNINATTDLSEGIYPEGTVITYNCKKPFIMDGENSIICKTDQTWSHHIPKCIKVSEFDINCDTKGSDVIEDIGIPVKIYCPPGCINVEGDVWGTIIYKDDSSVCAAAIHSGKLESNGGSVYVINYGIYKDFLGSNLNEILSHSFLSKARSFQLESISSHKINFRDRIIGCPSSWNQIDEYCIFINYDKKSWNKAKYICQNIGGHLITLQNGVDEKLKRILQNKGLNNTWIGLRQYSNEFKWEGNNDLTKNEKWSNEELNDENDCVSLNGNNGKLKTTDCNHQLPSVCAIDLVAKNKAKCKLPAPINNGRMDYQETLDNEVPEGFTIKFSCDEFYSLKGNKSITCTKNGNWNNLPPECIKVIVCEEPPTPRHGRKEISFSQSLAISRVAVFNNGLPEDNSPQNSKNDKTNIEIPTGYYKIGSVVKYSCESRYYQLVGSKARRCQNDGTWTGRIASCIPICGRSDSKRAPFILHGNATEIGQWPWQAAIARQISDSNEWFILCGGALLTEEWVISAAHCVTTGATNKIIDPDNFKIYLGKYYRDDKLNDDFVQERKAQEIHIHPDFDPHLFDSDIALIHLAEPVTLTARVQTVCLPSGSTTRENIVDGKIGVVTGWGLNENKSYAQQLQQAVLPVVSYERCEKGYEEANLPLTVTANMFCAGSPQTKSDACSGDSGGPMVFADDTGRERKWILEGITSWGSPVGCGIEGQYGGFTKVFNYLTWIHQFF